LIFDILHIQLIALAKMFMELRKNREGWRSCMDANKNPLLKSGMARPKNAAPARRSQADQSNPIQAFKANGSTQSPFEPAVWIEPIS
jgi:hypothetical protein